VGALDIEVADFAKVKKRFVKTALLSHAPFVDLVRYVVDGRRLRYGYQATTDIFTEARCPLS
jgi:hypothetical protein